MGERSGVGMVELVILEALDCLGARFERPNVSNARVLAEVEKRVGLAPGYGYEVLADLARPWTVPVRLVHGEGNYGELRDDEPTSPFRHTGSRLSPAGSPCWRLSAAPWPRCPSGSSATYCLAYWVSKTGAEFSPKGDDG